MLKSWSLSRLRVVLSMLLNCTTVLKIQFQLRDKLLFLYSVAVSSEEQLAFNFIQFRNSASVPAVVKPLRPVAIQRALCDRQRCWVSFTKINIACGSGFLEVKSQYVRILTFSRFLHFGGGEKKWSKTVHKNSKQNSIVLCLYFAMPCFIC